MVGWLFYIFDGIGLYDLLATFNGDVLKGLGLYIVRDNIIRGFLDQYLATPGRVL